MSIGNYLTALDEQRDQLARNLLTMGVQASETEKLNTLVPKVLQIPQTKPDITLFKASIDALHDYGEKVYTSIMTAIAPLQDSQNPTSISAVRRMAMPFTTISRTSTGVRLSTLCA